MYIGTCRIPQNVGYIIQNLNILNELKSAFIMENAQSHLIVGLWQGFWYFAWSRICEIQTVYPWNPVKFIKNPTKYMSVQQIWNLFWLLGLVTVPPGTIDPSGLGHTSSLPRVVAARPPRWKNGRFAVKTRYSLPWVKRPGVPQERTMGTGCISKISVSMSEDILIYCKCSRCE